MKRPLVSPAATPAFDWLMGVLAALVVAGIFQDGWAHNHGLVDQSFYTPWHAVLYGTMALNGLVLLGCGLLNLRRGFSFRNGLPYGYWLAAIGVVLFLLGGGLDLAWHTLFGIEEDINALISPTHLLLALAAVFVISGPLRSVAKRVAPSARASWRDTGPAILASASILSLLGFFTMYANPIGSTSGVTVMAKSDRRPVVSNIYAMRADGSRQTRVTVDASDDEFGAAVSPDGKWIAYRSSSTAGKAEIFLSRLNGSAARQLTKTGGWASQPAWSPDGKRVAFVSAPVGRSGDFKLITVSRDGSGAKTLVDSVAEINGPAFTPDGSKIAYGTRNGVATQIALVPSSGGAPTFVPGTQGGSYPSFSRDAKLLAFSVSVPRRGIALVRLGLPNPRYLGAGSMPAFSPRGDKIAYVVSGRGADDIGMASGAHYSGSANLTQLSGMHASRPAWTPDGRSILYSAGANGSVLDTDIAQAFAVDTFLVSSVLLMGALLVLMRRFALPLGAVTVLVLIYTAQQATQQDHYFAIAPALISAILADVLISIGNGKLRSGAPFYAFAFAFSLVFTALFIISVNARAGGLGWPPDLTYGTPVLAGFAGLLVAFCCAIPLPAPRTAQALSREAPDLIGDFGARIAPAD